MGIGPISGTGGVGRGPHGLPDKEQQKLEQFTADIMDLINNQLGRLPIGKPLPPNIKELLQDLASQAGALEQRFSSSLTPEQKADLGKIQNYLEDISKNNTMTQEDHDRLGSMLRIAYQVAFPND